MSKPLPTLTFAHKFFNGLAVTLRVTRAEFECPEIVSSHHGFHEGIEREYRQWVHSISNRMVEERLITEGEVVALALRNCGVQGKSK